MCQRDRSRIDTFNSEWLERILERIISLCLDNISTHGPSFTAI